MKYLRILRLDHQYNFTQAIDDIFKLGRDLCYTLYIAILLQLLFSYHLPVPSLSILSLSHDQNLFAH